MRYTYEYKRNVAELYREENGQKRRKVLAINLSGIK